MRPRPEKWPNLVLQLQPEFEFEEVPQTLNQYGILEEVEELVRQINRTYKKYAFPPIPLIFIILGIAAGTYGILELSGNHDDDKKNLITGAVYLPLQILFVIGYAISFITTRTTIQAVIKEFNTKMESRNIWAKLRVYYSSRYDRNSKQFVRRVSKVILYIKTLKQTEEMNVNNQPPNLYQ